MLSPEIRKDPELLKLSRDIRLFFSYLLMSADDAGNFDGDELKVKMETFPGDGDVTVEIVQNWLLELTKGNRKRGFVIPYCGDKDDGDRIYYHVRQFQKHQPIPHPTAPSYPLFPGQSYTYHKRDKGGKWENHTVTRPNCTRKCTKTVHVQYKICTWSLTPERKLREVKVREKDLNLQQPADNPDAPPPSKQKFLDFVMLTEKEHAKLIERFGEAGTVAMIDRLNNGIGSKGYKYKSHYHTILSWAAKDGPSQPPSEQPPPKSKNLCVEEGCVNIGIIGQGGRMYCRKHNPESMEVGT
jgi:hypothetical protein